MLVLRSTSFHDFGILFDTKLALDGHLDKSNKKKVDFHKLRYPSSRLWIKIYENVIFLLGNQNCFDFFIYEINLLGVNADSSGEEDSDDEDDIHKGQPETHDLVSSSFAIHNVITIQYNQKTTLIHSH